MNVVRRFPPRPSPRRFLAAQAVVLAPAFAAPADDDALVKRGEYLARLGRLRRLPHYRRGRQVMAGGLAFKTPTGTIYSTNITPDAKTGIGGYTLEQFDGALRRGVAADGHSSLSSHALSLFSPRPRTRTYMRSMPMS